MRLQCLLAFAVMFVAAVGCKGEDEDERMRRALVGLWESERDPEIKHQCTVTYLGHGTYRHECRAEDNSRYKDVWGYWDVAQGHLITAARFKAELVMTGSEDRREVDLEPSQSTRILSLNAQRLVLAPKRPLNIFTRVGAKGGVPVNEAATGKPKP